jgi:hypothetical protein
MSKPARTRVMLVIENAHAIVVGIADYGDLGVPAQSSTHCAKGCEGHPRCVG